MRRKGWIGLLGIVVVLVLLPYLSNRDFSSGCSYDGQECVCTTTLCTCGNRQYPPCAETPTITINQKTFRVGIAATDLERARGLMYRKRLAKDEGMLFLFPEKGPLAFWMKNTLIPQDMIFLDEDWKIVALLEALPCTADPCPSYPSSQEAQYVLEIQGGLGKQFAVGDEALLEKTFING